MGEASGYGSDFSILATPMGIVYIHRCSLHCDRCPVHTDMCSVHDSRRYAKTAPKCTGGGIEAPLQKNQETPNAHAKQIRTIQNDKT